jgi:hypothetical protein
VLLVSDMFQWQDQNHRRRGAYLGPAKYSCRSEKALSMICPIVVNAIEARQTSSANAHERWLDSDLSFT